MKLAEQRGDREQSGHRHREAHPGVPGDRPGDRARREDRRRSPDHLARSEGQEGKGPGGPRACTHRQRREPPQAGPMSEPEFLDVEDALAIHNEQLAHYGGAKGIRTAAGHGHHRAGKSAPRGGRGTMLAMVARPRVECATEYSRWTRPSRGGTSRRRSPRWTAAARRSLRPARRHPWRARPPEATPP
jgi:hypothetical protein